MRKQKIFLFIAVFFYVISSPADIFAQRGGSSGGALEIKLASPLPRNSPWGQTLDRIASEWARVTNNEVRLRILHNGQEGGEAQMLASLSSNNIQAALFTSFGLSTICPSILTLSVPFYIKTDAQLTAVLREVTPIMEDQVAKTDFFVVAWSKVGWVNVFSKDPVFVPDDLRRMRIATNSESKDLNTVLKTMGFQMVEAEMNDVGTKLMSGAIAAIYQNPAAVVAFQLHRTLRNMMATPIAPA
ncbi:MAG: TRAP transporter substrate-binding protein DctP, partial [Treponema sp.]|nr:TRAP transporter substrate-binding protein DctP [Treponema sp.]